MHRYISSRFFTTGCKQLLINNQLVTTYVWLINQIFSLITSHPSSQRIRILAVTVKETNPASQWGELLTWSRWSRCESVIAVDWETSDKLVSLWYTTASMSSSASFNRSNIWRQRSRSPICFITPTHTDNDCVSPEAKFNQKTSVYMMCNCHSCYCIKDTRCWTLKSSARYAD